jgi:tetratricopeptide (TPR) repeat protein
MNNPRRAALATLLVLASLPMGCRAPGDVATPPAAAPFDALAAAAAAAHQSNRPLAVLVVDPSRSDADRAARAAFQSAVAADPVAASVVLDLGVSRNRSAAAPLHALDGPTLECISPAGVIISHDPGVITAPLVRQRIDEAVRDSPAMDGALNRLRAALLTAPTDARAQMDLAAFFLAHQNDREAIPPLDALAHNANADLAARVHAWVEAGRAHLRIGEPEKARHSAQQLIATLGPTSPDAIAGGNLVRGLQDTRAKRFDRAADELRAAIAAAADSAYGKEAAELLAKLPGGGA